MRLIWPMLGLALIVVGCVSAPDAPADPTASPVPTVAPQPAGPVEVVNETYDFTTNPEGATHDVPVEFPVGARTFDFTVTWTSTAPTGTTRGVRVSLFDDAGSRVGDCFLDTNVVTQPEGRGCGPQTNNVRDGAYNLRWEGTGTVQARVLITAE